VFGSFLTARIGVEFWNAKGKDATSVVREGVEVVRVFEEFPTVFNCSVLTFGVQ
jgi:hypothetical protein